MLSLLHSGSDVNRQRASTCEACGWLVAAIGGLVGRTNCKWVVSPLRVPLKLTTCVGAVEGSLHRLSLHAPEILRLRDLAGAFFQRPGLQQTDTDTIGSLSHNILKSSSLSHYLLQGIADHSVKPPSIHPSIPSFLSLLLLPPFPSLLSPPLCTPPSFHHPSLYLLFLQITAPNLHPARRVCITILIQIVMHAGWW